MTCRLAKHIAEHGAEITVGHQRFRIEQIRTPKECLDDGLHMATARSARSSYMAMQTRDRLIGQANAECWAILMGKRWLNFAVTDQGIRKITG